MEKLVLFCVLSYRIIHISSGDVWEADMTVLRFRMNGNITLSCNRSDRTPRVAWYHQDPDSGRLALLMTAYYEDLQFYETDQKDRFFSSAGPNTVWLVIQRLTESDAGLYFCGKSDYPDVVLFEKPIRLVMDDGEDKIQSVTDPPEDDQITVSTAAVKLTERVLVFGGVGLAVFVLFLATVVAGGIIHCYGWQKGWAAARRAGLTD